jgi:hypothetical protein
VVVGLALLAVISAMMWLWLWFMIKRRQQWEAVVDWEQAFLVRNGIVSTSSAEKTKAFEKGLGQKIVVGAAAVLGSLGILTFSCLLIVR